MQIVVIGGSLGWLTTACDIRRLLPRGKHGISVFARERRFTFIPSLRWVAMGSKTLDGIPSTSKSRLARKATLFVAGAVIRIGPEVRKVDTIAAACDSDNLVFATGHRGANEAGPGRGPVDGGR